MTSLYRGPPYPLTVDRRRGKLFTSPALIWLMAGVMGLTAAISKRKLLTAFILNEVRGIVMTAPVWYALFKHWFHH